MEKKAKERSRYDSGNKEAVPAMPSTNGSIETGSSISE